MTVDSTLSASALEVTHLFHRYRRRGPWTLDDVSLRIPRSAIAALIGPNGAGKSTLMRSWVGFETPTRGQITVDGLDVLKDRERAVANVGYLSQSVNLYQGLSIRAHLDLAEELRPSFDRRDATRLLDQLQISVAARAGHLSGGQQAQAALALTLATKARVYLLDEPLASLDPLARQEFLAILVDEVRGRSATALLSSHIVSDVDGVCDWLVLLGVGRVAVQGPVAVVLADHRVHSEAHGDRDDVGTFARPGRGTLTLRRSVDPRLPMPTLDELVMGYLAAGRHRLNTSRT